MAHCGGSLTRQSQRGYWMPRLFVSVSDQSAPFMGVEPYPAIADMDLQPVAVMLQLVHQPGLARGCLATIGRHG